MNELINYGITDAALEDLKNAYGDLVVLVDDPIGYKDLTAAMREVRTIRTGVEKKRKELNKDAQEWIKNVNSEAARITSKIVAIENPLKENKKQIDDEIEKRKKEKALAEERRVKAISQKINEIYLIPQGKQYSSAKELKELLEFAMNINIDDTFDEFKEKAQDAKEEVIVDIRALFNQRSEFESEQKRLEEKKEA